MIRGYVIRVSTENDEIKDVGNRLACSTIFNKGGGQWQLIYGQKSSC